MRVLAHLVGRESVDHDVSAPTKQSLPDKRRRARKQQRLTAFAVDLAVERLVGDAGSPNSWKTPNR
jgi:hypothetical protein